MFFKIQISVDFYFFRCKYKGVMIRKFRLSNFCSFLDEVEVDFTVGAKVSTDFSFAELSDGRKASLTSGVFGANASGKTNLLKALAFLRYFMWASYHNLSPEEAIPVDVFSGVTDTSKPACFEIEFEGKTEKGDLQRYLYKLKLDSKKVYEEVLKVYNSKTNQYNQIMVRKQESTSDEPNLLGYNSFSKLSAVQKLLADRPNSSMLAAGLNTGRQDFKNIESIFGKIRTNVRRRGKENTHFDSFESLLSCSEYFHEHPEYQSMLKEFIQVADVGIKDFEIKPILVPGNDEKTKDSHLIYFVHQGPDKDFELNITQESTGTKRLCLLMYEFISILKGGGIAIIDEMESDLHPHLIPTILSLFNNPEINEQQAQLFFTCHHVEILNYLFKEQIILVEKDNCCVSDAYRLDEIKGVRKQDNFFANYNSGKYGAVPNTKTLIL